MILISEAEPKKFMTAFADAVAGSGSVFLCDPAWGESERGQLAELRQQLQTTPATAAGKGWLCIPTGGTSGKLKFARHDEDTLAAAVRGFARYFSLARVNAVGVLPLHHVSGLMAWMRCALTGGEYRPLEWKSLENGAPPELPVRAEGWVISLVPTQLERLLRQEATILWLQQFRLIFLGGAPAGPGLLDQAADRRLPLVLSYGMTETAAMITALHPTEFLAGARNCGPALPHATVKIGPDGTIQIESGALFRGYHPAWRAEGGFAPADRGSLDPQGHLHLLGRSDQIINTGGEKVDPSEVEAALRRSGEFNDVVVLGVPDAKWGERVVAAYPATSRPNLTQVAAALSQWLAPAKCPKQFVPLTDWPVNEQGKVNRAEVARMVQAKH
ncbi:MAG: AMP-binding protein [Opitutae bacterium]